jgi:hypothetical protein
VRLIGSHPLLDQTACESLFKPIDDLYEYRTERFEARVSLARQSQSQFLSVPPRVGIFKHVDIVAKRDSKSEVTLLIDFEADPIPDKMESFFLCPVEQNLILSPRTRQLRVWQKSMSFPDLMHAIDFGDTVKGQCDICNTVTVFHEANTYTCSQSDCSGRDDLMKTVDSIHPGNNRQYYGPVIPNLGRVWVGNLDKISKRGRLGLINATIYSLFHDGTDVNRRGRVSLKFPAASPKIQWALFPY